MAVGTEAPLKWITIDTHVHSCLSPCATLDMTPVKIVREALKRKLAMIAITDHNSAEMRLL
ncbi:MAG: PHP domain-containing protein [Deltaproteobacteria bacterium]|nr:PHP domain-containing protein [Deltaproteobacteria bacterium]